jgi:group I intron endonuclease
MTESGWQFFRDCARWTFPQPRTSGVYAIVNVFNGKAYIGSAVDIANRWRHHIDALRAGRGQRRLQPAWDKYGESLFRFVVLDRTDASRRQLLGYEQYWIDDWKAAGKYGYNIRVDASSNLGLRSSDETRAKISAANVGRKLSLNLEERERRRQRFKALCCGKKTLEYRAAASARSKGVPKPYLKGVPMAAAVKSKISRTLTGRAFSDIHRQRLSDAAKRRYAKT